MLLMLQPMYTWRIPTPGEVSWSTFARYLKVLCFGYNKGLSFLLSVSCERFLQEEMAMMILGISTFTK